MPCVSHSAPPRFDSGSNPLYLVHVLRLRPASLRLALENPVVERRNPSGKANSSEISRSLAKLPSSMNCAPTGPNPPPFPVHQFSQSCSLWKATTPFPGPATIG